MTLGPGGPLYDFLIKHSDDSPTLMINYDNFSSEEIIKFNAMLDVTAKADGTALPVKTKIIGFINTRKLNCYQGDDFYSRFQRVETCPLSKGVLRQAEQRVVFHAEPQSKKSKELTVINLFHASDWREKLMGHWELDGEHLQFEEGELSKALATRKPIQINQGFWADDAFRAFVLENIPVGTQLIAPNETYDWQALSSCINEFEPFIDKPIHTLNPRHV